MRLFITTAALLALVLPLAAQQNPPSNSDVASTPPPSSDIVVLSPFVVSQDKVTGYLATTTLAGTRLRQSLADVGTSITVLTSEFFQDTGAATTESMLTYVTGAEVAGLSGNFLGGSVVKGYQGSSSENLTDAQKVTRLRGLAQATESRDYFNTLIPLDTYNVERVEINRGANSILFGTGSPAGIINSSLKQAIMRDRYVIEGRMDVYGSWRGTFDLNKSTGDHQLAIRLAGLDNKQKFQQEEAYVNDQRAYGALTYAPKWARTANGALSATIVRANFEQGSLDSEKPRTLPPLDVITGWFNPWFNAYPAKLVWDAATLRTNSVVNGEIPYNSPGVSTIQIAMNRNPSVWFADPGSASPGTGYTFNGTAIAGMQAVLSNLPSSLYPRGTAVFGKSPTITYAATRIPSVTNFGYYITPTLSDDSIFDFRNHLLEGPNRFEYADFSASDITLEQRFFNDRAGVELAFDKQTYKGGDSAFTTVALSGENLSATMINIDYNSTLLNGATNPNFGRPFMSGAWMNNYKRQDRDSRRLTGYYRFDFADISKSLGRWLGHISLTGLDERTNFQTVTLTGPRYAAPDYLFGNTPLITDSTGNALGQMSYLGPSLASATSARGAHIPGLTARQEPTASAGQSFLFRGQTATSVFAASPLNIVEDSLIPTRFATVANQARTKIHAQVLVLDHKFFADSLVATLGWRRDIVDAYTAPIPARGALGNLIVDQSWKLPAIPSSSVTGDTSSRSLVFHLPAAWVKRSPAASSLSLRYSHSDNFAPDRTRFDSDGKVISPPAGATRDVGFSLGLLENRVVITASWYETSQKNVTASGIGGLTRSIVDTWANFTRVTALGLNPSNNTIIAPPTALLNLYGFTVTGGSTAYNNRDDIVLTQDFVSKGVELEAFANLTRNWRMFVNLARQESVQDQSGPIFRELFFERLQNGQTLFENWTSNYAQTMRINEGTATLRSYALTNIVYPYNTAALQDGGVVQELRKWRVNLVTNYSFDRGTWLEGISIGGGMRWQSPVAIGYPTVTDNLGAIVPDINRPFFGPKEWNLDSWLRYERSLRKGKMKLTVQLNVTNLTGRDELVPIAAQPDGTSALFRIPARRNFQLSTKLEF